MKTLQIQKDILSLLNKNERVFVEIYKDNEVMVALNSYGVFVIPKDNFFIDKDAMKETKFDFLYKNTDLEEISKTNNSKTCSYKNKSMELAIFDYKETNILVNKKLLKYFEKKDDLTYFIDKNNKDIKRSPVFVKNYDNLIAIVMPFVER